jgi:hypothetical protein
LTVRCTLVSAPPADNMSSEDSDVDEPRERAHEPLGWRTYLWLCADHATSRRVRTATERPRRVADASTATTGTYGVLLFAALGCSALALLLALQLSQAHAKLALSSANLHLTTVSRVEQERGAESERLVLSDKLRDMNASFRHAQRQARRANVWMRQRLTGELEELRSKNASQTLWAERTLEQLRAVEKRERETQEKLTATARAAWHERNYFDITHSQLEAEVDAELNRSQTALNRLRARLRHLRFEGAASPSAKGVKRP